MNDVSLVDDCVDLYEAHKYMYLIGANHDLLQFVFNTYIKDVIDREQFFQDQYTQREVYQHAYRGETNE